MSTTTDSIGRVLARRYRIESALGSGTSATVYAAWDVVLQRRVAIKVLHPGLAGDGSFLRRFRYEAQSAAALTHPHVLSVYDWGEDERGPFLVLEYLGGGSLRDLLDNGRRVSVAQAAAIGVQAADGLWPTRTDAASSTATSSPPTSSSTRTAGCGSPTSAWPGPWPRRP